MKVFFSWLKKSAEDADRISDAGAALSCLCLFAGTLALAAGKPFDADSADLEAELSSEAVPARIRVNLADFVPVPETTETEENAPEELPPAPEILPADKEPEPQQEPPPEQEKINESSLREIIETPPPPEEEKLPEPPEEKEPVPREEPPPPQEEEKPEPEKTAPPQEYSPPASAPAAVPAAAEEDDAAAETARAAAKQTLYGALADAVRRKKFYPKAARRNGRTGAVSLLVEIGGDGKIAAVTLRPGDTHESLKAGALETLRRVKEDFRAPAGTDVSLPAAFILPVVYELN